MSEDGKGRAGINGALSNIELRILFNPATRRVDVIGPVHDRMLCYGMLGMAMESLVGYGIEKRNQRIEVPQIVPPRT